MGGVDLAVHELEGDRRTRTGRLPHVRREPRDQPLVGLVTGRAPVRDLAPRELEAAPQLLHTSEVRRRVLLVVRLTDREVGHRAE